MLTNLIFGGTFHVNLDRNSGIKDIFEEFSHKDSKKKIGIDEFTMNLASAEKITKSFTKEKEKKTSCTIAPDFGSFEKQRS